MVIGCFISSIAIVLILFLAYGESDTHPYGFTRKVRQDLASKINEFDLHYNSYYLAGVTKGNIFLGNFIATNLLTKTNYDFTDSVHMRFNLSGDIAARWDAAKFTVNFPHIYLTEGTTPIILHTKSPSFGFNISDSKPCFFLTFLPLSPRSYILKVFDIRQNQHVLTKKNAGMPYDTYQSGILEMQGDGRFSVDGRLIYEPQTARLVYTYLYRNQFICMDTSLNIIYKANTIDTINTAQIEVGEVNSGSQNRFSMSKPPLFVNKNSSATRNWIFNHSGLMAENEDMNTFNNSSVIDVYSLQNGDYKLSFYLADFKGHKLRDFMVYDDILIGIFDKYLVTFKLNIHALQPT